MEILVGVLIGTVVTLLVIIALLAKEYRYQKRLVASQDRNAVSLHEELAAARTDERYWRNQCRQLEMQAENDCATEEDMKYIEDSLRRAADGDPTT